MSEKNKKHVIIISVLVCILLLLVAAGVLLSLRLRSSHYEGSAITTELSLIDSYIQQGDTKQAIAALKRIESRAHSAGDRMGLYKRYMALSEYDRAEKCLKKALRSFPSDKDFIALYGNFLLRRGRVKDAMKRTKSLSGSPYSSIYAEAVLRCALASDFDADSFFAKSNPILNFFRRKATPSEKAGQEAKRSFFLDERFIPIYKDAYYSSRLPVWQINAATILMAKGSYEEASFLYPGEVAGYKDALFWGLVTYDAGRYAESLEALLKAEELGKLGSASEIAELAQAIELKALLSDDYYILGDDASAQAMRKEVLAISSPYMDAFMDERIPSLGRILPLLYMNTAIYARDSGDEKERYDKLYQLVNYFPDYEPGLAAYGEYAIDSVNRPEEVGIEAQLRQAGLRTLAMEERDSVPVVPISTVVDMIDEAIKNVKAGSEPGNDQKIKTASLIVLREKMLAAEKFDSEKAEKASKVWKLLETNELAGSLYPPEIMRYAVANLIENGGEDDAERIFRSYLQASYGEDEEQDKAAKDAPIKKAFEPCENPEKLALWEGEIAAYFYVQREEYSKAIKLYDYILSNYSKRTPVFNTAGQNEAVISSYLNMGNIYSGYNRSAQALDYLRRADSRVTDSNMKAEVRYRIGYEEARLGRSKDALITLKHALELNPDHSRARLLLKQMQ
ncbi:MAG: tetratricopeptide repeat protein [Treponema sp.]|nr:tetratricopeptide repeat protein [Treponema sp.]